MFLGYPTIHTPKFEIKKNKIEAMNELIITFLKLNVVLKYLPK